jgi:hypothetical protein
VRGYNAWWAEAYMKHMCHLYKTERDGRLSTTRPHMHTSAAGEHFTHVHCACRSFTCLHPTRS